MKKTIVILAAAMALIAAMPAKKQARVARMWRGRVPNARAAEYQKYLDESGVQKLRAIKDNLGTQMFRRDLGDGTTEFVVISYWPNEDAIRAYAGDDVLRVHLLPRDPEFLIELPETIQIHRIVIDRQGLR